MSIEAFLEQVWLAECDVGCDARESMSMPMNMGIDIDDLAFDNREDGRVVVTVGMSLGLHPRGTDDAVADLTATYRLVYRMAPIDDLDAQRSFASVRALPDVWPVWRTWLHQTLSLMGLAPTPLPAQVPTEIVVEGSEAFDLTRQVQDLIGDAKEEEEMTAAGLWKKLHRELDSTRIDGWEFIAPRSGWPHRRGDVYKLFLRRQGARGRWWLFEDSIMQVPATYPGTGYGRSKDFDVFRGSTNMLEFVGVDDEHGGKEALKQVLDEVKKRLAAQKPLSVE